MAQLKNTPKRIFIIAEAGVNHNGSVELAKNLIDAAVLAGADAVKFQTFKAAKIVSRRAPKARYQIESTGAAETQYEMIKKLELDEPAHKVLLRHCRRRGIEFLSSPFDRESLDLLVRLGVSRVKLPSGEATNAPLLLETARFGMPVVLSTGMCSLREIETALGVLAFGYLRLKGKPSRRRFQAAYKSINGKRALSRKVTLLHCTSEYPAPFSEVHLRAMETLTGRFHLPVGLSDHTRGIAVPIAAAAMGAKMIEKHFTMDRRLPGPDHGASLEPGELKSMVESIRQVEKALGRAVKLPTPSELRNRVIVRKSLVAAKPIRKGECFTKDNLGAKRPANGISPLNYWDRLGKRAQRDYREDEAITK